MFPALPVMKLSIPITRNPSAKSRSDKCEPRKPAPPVTTAVRLGEFMRAGVVVSQPRLGQQFVCEMLRPDSSSEDALFRPKTKQHNRDRSDQNFYIQPDRPIIDVHEVELHPVL